VTVEKKSSGNGVAFRFAGKTEQTTSAVKVDTKKFSKANQITNFKV
jgi:hypothetical protein